MIEDDQTRAWEGRAGMLDAMHWRGEEWLRAIDDIRVIIQQEIVAGRERDLTLDELKRKAAAVFYDTAAAWLSMRLETDGGARGIITIQFRDPLDDGRAQKDVWTSLGSMDPHRAYLTTVKLALHQLEGMGAGLLWMRGAAQRHHAEMTYLEMGDAA